jgi:hypothetical protein
MTRSRWRYIFTWIALAIVLAGPALLMVLSWNNLFPGASSAALMIMIWILVSASGIFLFMLAVKKAHRTWINESRLLERQPERMAREKEKTAGPQKFEFAALARKLVRRIPEGASLEKAGEVLLQNLAREVEIMAGIFYVKKKGQFEATSTYAIGPSGEPPSFKEGEGLAGQVAKNRQVMLITRLPEDHLEVFSGLGKARPAYLAMVPFVRRNRTVAVMECSGYRYDPHDIENLLRILSRDLMQKRSESA